MKKYFYLLTLLSLLSALPANAQTYSVIVPTSSTFDSTYIVGQGMTDTFDINQHLMSYGHGQFLLCSNATLVFKGSFSSTTPAFFLSDGASLILKDAYFYPAIYMQPNATLDAQGGNQQLRIYRVANTSLTDTANANFVFDSLYTNISFDFSAWPNASDPCSLSPTSVKMVDAIDVRFIQDSRSWQYRLKSAESATFCLYNLAGQRLFTQKIHGQGSIALSHFMPGLYIATIQQGAKQVVWKCVVD